jgi:hypothetical protein
MGQLDSFADAQAIKPIEMPVSLPIADNSTSLGYLLLVEGAVHNKQLRLRITYSKALSSEAVIIEFSDILKQTLSTKSTINTVVAG